MVHSPSPFASISLLRGGDANVSSSNSIPPSLQGFPLEMMMNMGESALVDKETSRVYWQSGVSLSDYASSSLSSAAKIQHIRTTVLSVMLVVALVSVLLRPMVDFCQKNCAGRKNDKECSIIVKLLTNALYLFRPITHGVHSNRTAVLILYMFYLLESYNCSTRKYLTNVVDGEDVESRIEDLRNARPEVTWTVKCYHYAKRLAASRYLARSDKERKGFPGLNLPGKKVITHEATKQYDFASWEDNTVTTVFKRASRGGSGCVAPFTKLTFSKILMLADCNTRNDYFAQQSAFVTCEGQRDDHAEFSTKIEVKDFKPKILVMRQNSKAATTTASSKLLTKLFRIQFFWIFTLIGFSLPFRVLFASYCDTLCVTVVKEASSTIHQKAPSAASSHWLSPKNWIPAMMTSSSPTIRSAEQMFRKSMEEFSVYSSGSRNDTSQPRPVISNDGIDTTSAVLQGSDALKAPLLEDDEKTTTDVTTSSYIPENITDTNQQTSMPDTTSESLIEKHSDDDGEANITDVRKQ